MSKKTTEEIKEDDTSKKGSEEVKEETTSKEQKDEKDLRIEELEKEIYDLKNKYALAYADTENLKKRLLNEADQIRKYGTQSFLTNILPIIDNLERALDSFENKDDNFYKGIEMIYKGLKEALSKEGVEEIACLNEEFDPSKEQALMQEEKDGVKENIVIEVFQKGYMLKDRVLRSASVKVSK